MSRNIRLILLFDLVVTVPIEEWANFAAIKRLRKLSLGMNGEEGSTDAGRKSTRGDVGCFAAATQLRYLDLSVTKIHGSIQPIGEGLHHLTHLDLNRTKVEGDVATLLPLKHLRYLDLFRCYKIAGAVASLRELVRLKYLNLQGTDVEGNIEPLMALQGLAFLNVWSCRKVTGDKGRFRSAMKRLRNDPWASDDRLMNHGRPEDPEEHLFIDDIGKITAELIGEDDSDDE